MKKFIWLAFAVLAALWTGLVALTLQLTDWVLATIATAQVPGAALDTSQWVAPAWAAGWVDPAWLQSLQAGLVWAAQGLNQILPVAGSLGTLISVLGWIVWGFIIACLLVVALILNWLAGKRQQAAEAPGRQVV
ncbi:MULTISPECIES: hypothetical protein [unclassified Achromobacter]|jgi:hypothetical protein|uniref:hypothetical protein n=1 Tax=unclassified Achromobacter TaxID=2626865 RepID=UPI000CFBE0EF|nr:MULTISPECIES: hypothetical protein [unclassified Achromobacter]PQZ70482.1 hypothetical protein CQ050_07785 [Achromobacter sp. MYb9]